MRRCDTSAAAISSCAALRCAAREGPTFSCTRRRVSIRESSDKIFIADRQDEATSAPVVSRGAAACHCHRQCRCHPPDKSRRTASARHPLCSDKQRFRVVPFGVLFGVPVPFVWPLLSSRRACRAVVTGRS